jgi:hypothetical protein
MDYPLENQTANSLTRCIPQYLKVIDNRKTLEINIKIIQQNIIFTFNSKN